MYKTQPKNQGSANRGSFGNTTKYETLLSNEGAILLLRQQVARMTSPNVGHVDWHQAIRYDRKYLKV